MTEERSSQNPSAAPNEPPGGHVPDHDDDAPERPPPGVHTMAVVRWAILILMALAAVGTWWSFARAERGASSSAAKYQCPMHPQIVSDQPGECPICHMSLEPISAERLQAPQATSAPQAPAPSAAPSPSGSAPSGTVYTCPMHPEIVSDKPGSCPICHMDLEPKQAGAAPTGPVYTCPMHPEIVSDKPGSCPICHMDLEPKQAQAEPPPPAGAPGSIPAGTTPIHLSLDRQQAIGVRTTVVEEQPAFRSVRATATVQAPEQNVAQVHVRAPGFVEAISVNETGVKVKRGQLLVSIYSPEIYQAQSELLATRNWGSLSDAGSDHLAQAARRKLSLLGVGDRVADQVLAEGKPMRTTGVSAPISGFVSAKNVVLGAYVTPDMVLYEIVDLSKVYVVADVFEQNMASLSIGTVGRFTSSSQPAAKFEAKIDLIYPQVNPEARTTRVRMQVKNPDLALRPGEYGYVEFAGPSQTAVLVPRDAVIDTGRQLYVFVETSPGQFAPRTVELGPEVGDKLEVRAGLKPGERVVSGATFLIDSESRLQASLAAQPAPAPAADTSCDGQFDKHKYPDKYNQCRACEQAHQGMGAMVDDCKNAIAKPWK